MNKLHQFQKLVKFGCKQGCLEFTRSEGLGPPWAIVPLMMMKMKMSTVIILCSIHNILGLFPDTFSQNIVLTMTAIIFHFFLCTVAGVRELLLSAVHCPARHLLDLHLQEGARDQKQDFRRNRCLIQEGGGGQRQRADRRGTEKARTPPVRGNGSRGEEPRDL